MNCKLPMPLLILSIIGTSASTFVLPSLAQSAETASIVHRANELANSGNCDQAIEFYKKALLQMPRSDTVNYDLGYAYLKGKHDDFQAREYLQKAVDLNPQNKEAWLSLGQAQKHLKDFKNAELAFKHAVALAPRNCGQLCELGYLYMDTGRLKESQAILTKARSLPESKRPEFSDLGPCLDYVNKQLSGQRTAGE